MRINIFLLAITLGLTTYTNSQTNEITTKDVFKEIDIVRHKKIIEELKGENVKQKKQAIDSILINPNYYIPPVLYVLSMELYTQDRKEEAAFWFYVAQLRARYDANLCIDNSAKEAVSILNQEYGIGINTYAFQNIDSLKRP